MVPLRHKAEGESVNTPPGSRGFNLEEVVVMTDFPMISPLSDTELDAVTGGTTAGIHIRQNARGGDSISYGGNGGAATTTGAGAATGGAGGASTAAIGGAGGHNTITGPL
jgi:hypothetical protein